MATVRLCVFLVLANSVKWTYGQDIMKYSHAGGQDMVSGSHSMVGGVISSGPEADSYNGTDCIDRKGRRVKVGQIYNPSDHSPCTICECLEDKMMMSCSSEGCDSLKCLNFYPDPDSCCGYTCKDNKTVAGLDVRQVGKDAVIVQWALDEQYSNYTISKMKLAYSNDSGMYGKLDFKEIPVVAGADSAIVSGLQSGMVYIFTGVGEVEHQYYPIEVPVRATEFALEPRTSDALELQRRFHEKKLRVQTNAGGKFQWPDKMYVNMNTFSYVTEESKMLKNGKMWMTIKLHNHNSDVVMRFTTRDIKVYRWIMAHM